MAKKAKKSKKPAAKAAVTARKPVEKAKPLSPPQPVANPVPKKSGPEEVERGPDVSRIGRPKKLVEDDALIKQILGLANIKCTYEEAAAALLVSENTFRAFLKENPRSAEAFAMGPAFGRASLRRLQWRAAQKGDVKMLIWLGKQLLDQRDKVGLGGLNGGPVKVKTLADFYADPQSSSS